MVKALHTLRPGMTGRMTHPEEPKGRKQNNGRARALPSENIARSHRKNEMGTRWVPRTVPET